MAVQEFIPTNYATFSKGGGFSRPSAGAAFALAPLGAQIQFFADGTYSEGAAGSLRNIPWHTLMLMNGRIIPGPGWMQAKSGSTMASMTARQKSSFRQKSHIFIFGSVGHNDNLLATDPDIDPTQLNAWKVLLDLAIASQPFTTAGGYCYYFGVNGDLPSGLAGEIAASSFNAGITIRQRVWNLQAAYVAAKGDARIGFIDFSSYSTVAGVNADDSGVVHPGNPGGRNGGQRIAAWLDSRVVAATAEEIIEMHRLGTFPGLGATQLHPDNLLPGTAGTKNGSGSTPTGNVATNQRATNNTSTEIVASKDTSVGTYESQVATFGATANSAENNVLQDRATSFPLTGAIKGSYALGAERVLIDNGASVAPKGLWSLAYSMGVYGSVGAASVSSAALVAPAAHTIDTVLYASPLPIYSPPPVGFMAVTERFQNADLLGNRVIYNRPSVRLVSTPSQGPAEYIGGDTISTANYVMNISGTISATTFGTITMNPGRWTPYGFTIDEARIYRGGGLGGQDADQNLGAGTLMATITGPSIDTYVTGAGNGMIPTDVLTMEITAHSSVGGTVIRRSNVGITVGA